MKVALINPGAYSTFQPPLSLGYLASCLLEFSPDVSVKIIDENAGEHLQEEVEKYSPDLIGITATTPLMVDAVRVAEEIKKRSSLPIVIGGFHVTALPELTFKQYKCFDIAILGEGEETFSEVVSLYKNKGAFSPNSLSNVSGLAYRDKSNVLFSKPRLPLTAEAMNRYPPPARSLLNMDYYLKPRDVVFGMLKRSTQMMTSRGCPYNCRFCGSQVVNNRRWRSYTPDRVLAEMKALAEDFGVEVIFLQDDMFSVNRKRAEEICHRIIESGLNNKISWMYQERANFIHPELLNLYKEAGCVQLSFGLESGSPSVLNYLKKDKSTVEQNQRAVDITHSAGLRLTPSFMIGNFNETMEDLNMTLDFIKKNLKKMDQVQLYIATPYPGSQMWEDWVRENKIKLENIDWSHFWMGLSGQKVYVCNKISPAVLEKLYNRFLFRLNLHYNCDIFFLAKKFFDNPKKFIRLLLRVSIGGLFSKPPKFLSEKYE